MKVTVTAGGRVPVGYLHAETASILPLPQQHLYFVGSPDLAGNGLLLRRIPLPINDENFEADIFLFDQLAKQHGQVIFLVQAWNDDADHKDLLPIVKLVGLR